jgi:hypothetical protein
MPEAIDWKSLAEQLGALKSGGESGSSSYAQQAVEMLLGEENLRQAVEYYIKGEPGSELARSVMWQIHPWSAMKYCYDIYKSDTDIMRRRLAVELLRVVADHRALGWVMEFLEDEDQEIQMWGAGLLDQLACSGLISKEDTEELLVKLDKHTNPHVQEIASSVRNVLNHCKH